MSALLTYVRAQGGEDAVTETLCRAGVAASPAELTDPARWVGYDVRIRLFDAATTVLGDPFALFHVGANALVSGLPPSVVLLLRAMGSPLQVYRRLPTAVPKFTTTSTMRVLESRAGHATLSYRLHDGYVHSRLDCQYAQGLLTVVPTVFGLPAARLVHDECEADGYPACVYHLRWDRSRRRIRRHRNGATELELTALRGQLSNLQSAAAELVGSQDLHTVLHRIVTRAAEAVLAPAYVLALRDRDGGPAHVYSSGLPADQAQALGERLLAGEDIGPGAVVVDVASARRSHGCLAALHRPGHGGLHGERALLAAYAGHAAAALDLLSALEESRLQARRAATLLGLAHELAAAESAVQVCEVVAAALPRVIGCTSASVMTWDAATQCLRACAAVGMDDARRDLFLSTPLDAGLLPEVSGIVADRTPLVITGEHASPAMQQVFEVLQLSDAVAVPLIAGSTFLGVATASWDDGATTPRLDGDLVARLRGVGDQAATALQKAQLLEAVHHQAHHDPLTGLPNRSLFSRRLGDELTRAGSTATLAVLFCDLDRFKQVNDTLGHAAGDELLRQVAERLQGAVRPGDTVGRLSGDEFALILPDVADRADADQLAQRVTECFATPFRLDGRDVPVTASVGVAVHVGSAGGGLPDDLLRAADESMYRRKARSRAGAPAG
ncbi:hypothetical protein GCM10023328_03500 [Modestobacter marinus]|uniref:Diguanylate cyclase (GGDEF)-like protein n=1 Tax=Modestobacter marinus TaxID=477641 RepID=A0A846LI40_9ACTN|nr:GGDEF domain-containing protein [Modestobacter marinus]NIH67227.1 diguanylate cyclase (GGDEF)-like protein [Modestobacter marinus]GGL53027.1 hypothetical protein GCM10011589_06470 [Modestobacter marinus]